MLYTNCLTSVFIGVKRTAKFIKKKKNDRILGKGHVYCQTGDSHVNSNASEG